MIVEDIENSNMKIAGEKIELGNYIRYLGVTTDSSQRADINNRVIQSKQTLLGNEQ